MEIRKIKRADNKAIATLIKKVFEEYNAPKEGTVYSDADTNRLYECFETEKAELWVAEDQGEILGSCGVYPTEALPNGCAELVKFYIAKEARGKGLGRKLMEASMASALQFEYQELYLESLPEFSDAVSWYKKLGFKMMDVRLGNSGHSSCNIWMLKKLA